MNQPVRPDWIAVDWGTSNLRAWAMSDGGDVLATARSEDGMGSLAVDQFESALLNTIEPWLGDSTINVVASGMVGAMQGWMNAPYSSTPCTPLSPDFARPPVNRSHLQVHIVPGISQGTPADVMRGEETQIAGFLAGQPDFDGVICLPGTHTKWVHISAGEIVSFQTFMSGELFSVIAQNTVLRHSIAANGWDDVAFMSALDDAFSHPQRLASRMFALIPDTRV